MTNKKRKEILEKYRNPMFKIYKGHRELQKGVLILKKSWGEIEMLLLLLKNKLNNRR